MERKEAYYNTTTIQKIEQEINYCNIFLLKNFSFYFKTIPNITCVFRSEFRSFPHGTQQGGGGNLMRLDKHGLRNPLPGFNSVLSTFLPLWLWGGS